MIAPEFSRPVALDRVGLKDRTYEIEADEAERAALARRLGVPAVNSLTAAIRLRLTGGGGMVRLSGRVRAELTQICVVTLEPIATLVEEEFTRLYGTTEAASGLPEVVIEMDEEDAPDPVEDGQIDIGEAAAEHLALAMDPFPRASDAAFVPIAEDEPEEERRPSPFALLAERRKKE